MGIWSSVFVKNSNIMDVISAGFRVMRSKCRMTRKTVASYTATVEFIHVYYFEALPLFTSWNFMVGVC